MKLMERLRGIVAAVATAALALSVAPMAAQAVDWTTGNETGSIVVNGEGFDASGVHVYKVADISLDTATNVTDLEPVAALEAVVNAWVASESATTAAAIVSADGFAATAVSPTITDNADPAGVTISGVDAGVYVITIDDSETTSFQTIVVALEPEAQADGTWEIKSASINVKSAPKGIEKTVVSVDGTTGAGAGDDKVYEVGDVVDFRVDFSVGADMSEFYLEDTMSEGLNFDSSSVKVYAGMTILTAGTHYDVVNSGIGSATFRVVFTAEGIAAAGGQEGVYMTYSATITDAATVAGGVTNKVTSNVNATGDTEGLGFAGIQVKKYDSKDESKLLQGAVFGLYVDAGCTNEIATATSGSDGIAAFGVLLDPSQTYYVKEISAPAGYKLDSTVYTVNGDGENDPKLEASKTTEISVANTASGTDEGIGLPETGGTGTVALTVAGVALMVGAGAWVMRARKEQ